MNIGLYSWSAEERRGRDSPNPDSRSRIPNLWAQDRICMSVAILPMAKEFSWPASVQVREAAAETAHQGPRVVIMSH